METYKKIRPVSTRIITTAETYKEDQKTPNGMLDPNKKKGNYMLEQTVLAVGPMVKFCEPGEKIKISIVHFLKPEVVRREMNATDQLKKHEINIRYNDWEIPEINAFGQKCFIIDQNDISFVIEEE